jgi:2-polyprenyl-3-methyl-5-hydroxy-6-metoxy-1,4-benzoquinol methylase
MDDDRLKWDERYGGEEFLLGIEPSAFLRENIEQLKSLCPGRRALDIACGEGRNSIFLARHGFLVTAVDISEKGVEKGRRRCEEEGIGVDFRLADLESYTITESYDLILNFNFLLRELIPKLAAALNSGGLLVFDTLLDSPLLEGVHNKLYLLQPGELRKLFAGFPGKILHYEERALAESPTARLIFQKQ